MPRTNRSAPLPLRPSEPKLPASAELRKLSVDAAYIKDSGLRASRTFETRDLGHRMSLDQLKLLSERCQTRPFDLGFDVPNRRQPVKKSPPSSTAQVSRPDRKAHQAQASVEGSASSPPTMTSNADVVRREIALQGEFDIISRSHVARFEQDSAFKKDRVITPEIMAIHNRQTLKASHFGKAARRRCFDESESS